MNHPTKLLASSHLPPHEVARDVTEGQVVARDFAGTPTFRGGPE